MRFKILIDSSDEKGLVYKVSHIFYTHNLNIEQNSEFVDKENNKFFMRSEVDGDVDIENIKKELLEILPADACLKIVTQKRKKIVLMVTKETHCIGDILMRHEDGSLNADIVAFIGNYDYLQSLVERFGITYYTVSHAGLSRAEHDAKIMNVLKTKEFDYLVLAKYMRILSPSFVQNYENKIINIHHSFLPAFIGANPYKQAYERGVKIIGATAHFVNNNLDEGPIIAQDITHVDHSFGWQDMRDAGRDVEKVVLSNALKLALEDKVFVYGNKTVLL